MEPVFIYLAILAVLLLVHAVVVFFTRFEKTITIKNKNPYSTGSGRSMHTRNAIMDSTGTIYSIKNELLLLHFSSAEVWMLAEEGKTYKVKGYGLRVPLLGWFPNIVSLEKA